jgi:hypothetical protein
MLMRLDEGSPKFLRESVLSDWNPIDTVFLVRNTTFLASPEL